MGRGMLRNIVKKTNASIVSIYDVNPKNIDDFMDSLTADEKIKVSVCKSPADVSENSSRDYYLIRRYFNEAAMIRNVLDTS